MGITLKCIIRVLFTCDSIILLKNTSWKKLFITEKKSHLNKKTSSGKIDRTICVTMQKRVDGILKILIKNTKVKNKVYEETERLV